MTSVGSCVSLSLCCIGGSLALLRLGLSPLISSSSIRSLRRLSLTALLGRSSGSLSSGLALATLLCGGGSSFGGGLTLSSLLRGGGGSSTSLDCLGLTILLSCSVATLVGSGSTTGSCDTSDINAGSIQSVDVVLVASGHDGFNGFLKVCTRVGRASCWVLGSAEFAKYLEWML